MKDVQQQNRSEITRGVVVVYKSFGKEGGIVCANANESGMARNRRSTERI